MSFTRVSEQENRKQISVIESKFSKLKMKLNDGKRLIVAHGSLEKVCRSQTEPRIFFLFNDILIYASNSYDAFSSYCNPHIYSLADVKIEDITVKDHIDSYMQHGWNIYTPKKSFTVYAENLEKKLQWMSKMQQYIGQQPKRAENKPTFYAPVWAADYEIDRCHTCKTRFTFVTRKHHCRDCGQIFCNACSDCKVILENISSKPVRVCRKCCQSGDFQQKRTSESETEFDETFGSSDSDDY